HEQDHAGARIPVEFDAKLTEQLRVFSQRHGVTLYVTLLTAFGALLSRLSAQNDVVVGTPVANRPRPEVEDLIGFFVNTLALRLDFSGNPRVTDALERVKDETL